MGVKPITIGVLVAGLALGACSLLSASQQADITKFLTGLSNKAQADLQAALAVANAATPPDTAGANCASALLSVQADVAKVITAATGAGNGPVTALEVATLFQPGSPQANGERDKIVQGCAVKVAQTSGAVAGTVGFFTQLGTMFAIAP